MALKVNTRNQYQFESIQSFGGSDKLQPIDYTVLKSSLNPPSSINLIDQVSAQMDRLEHMQRQLGLLTAEVKSVIIKN